jgi:putative FmdB family regulatory protein
VPIYEYKCTNGHVFETVQSMSEDPITKCEVCGAPVERVFHPIAVHFKGSGFYTTDYGSKAKASQDGAGKDSGESSKPEKKKGSKEKAKSASADD